MRYLVFVISLFSCSLSAQFTLSGRVVNDKNENLSFATVFLEGTSYAASTDESGRFTISNIALGTYDLKVTFIGYKAYRQTIQITKDQSVDIVLSGELFNLDLIEIQANRVGDNGPFTRQNLNKQQLQKENLGTDVPFILQWTPSMVVNSDAGTGVGYTGLRLRGSDQTRINVTLNGVPVNDAESQNVFWVDMPDLMGSVKSVQIQRGVGTSTNGAGAFGGTVSINTADVRINPYIDVAGTLGAFNTKKLSVNLGTGLINDRYTIDARYSSIKSDGYIDRASANLNSLFFSAARLTAKSSLRLNIISGREVTYQSWNGTPEAKVSGDNQALLSHYYNNLGSIYKSTADSVNLFSSDRRYNYYTYANQVDNYRQTHIQLLHSLVLDMKTRIKTTLFYTKGSGFFEEFKQNEALAKYGLPSFIDSLGTEVISTDLVRKRWLDNDLLGILVDGDHQLTKSITFQAGLAIDHYKGNHFGNVVFTQVPVPNLDKERKYYENQGNKSDISGYFRSIYAKGAVSIHGDVQLRKVIYDVKGIDNDLRLIDISNTNVFVNPKLGIHWAFKANQNVYASFAIANKEPSRVDFIDNALGNLPQSENLSNIEVGYQLQKNKIRLETNVYFMKYKNQLVQTGELNDVGAGIRQNVPDSYRLGWEGSVTYQVFDYLSIHANMTVSKNKIKSFDEVLFDYTTGSEKVTINHQNSDISFSPSVIGTFQVLVKPYKFLEVEWSSKYVGKQFLDNTSNQNRALSAYRYENLRCSYNIVSKYWKSASITMMVNNVLNVKYSSNGYTYSYIYDNLVTENFLYPQAGRHIMMGVKIGL